MILYNFSHPIKDLSIIYTLTGEEPHLVNVSTHIDVNKPLLPQVQQILKDAGLESRPDEPILINPPGLAPLAIALFVALYEKLGYYPPYLRYRAVDQGGVPTFVLAEIVYLDQNSPIGLLKADSDSTASEDEEQP